MTQDCIFCRIKSGDIPSEMLFMDDLSFVIRDINPVAPIHLLIIPIEHVTDISTSSQDQFDLLSHLMMVAKRMVDRHKDLTDNGWRLVINQGRFSGQEIPHLHLHILGGQKLGPIA
jgi:histidine triad (HIT) family protein